MRRALGLALPPLGAVLLLALLPGPAMAQAACPVAWSCSLDLSPSEAEVADVWVDEAAPDRNYDLGDGSQHLVVRAGDQQRARVLLRYPLEQVPRNITLHAVYLLLWADVFAPGRDLTMWEVREAWQESTVNWTTGRDLALSQSPMSNQSTPVLPQPGDDGLLGMVFNNCTDPTCPNVEPHASEGLTHSFRKYYLGLEAYHGHVIMDAGTVPAGLAAPQRFFSSAEPNITRRPVLTFTYDPRAAEVQDLRVDGREHVNASSARPVNVTAHVFDRLGRVTDVWVNATTPEGQEVFNRSVFQNRTTRISPFERHDVWSNASLGLAPGRYQLNVWVRDTDGNLNTTLFAYRGGNVTVENEPPRVSNATVSATELREGEALTARATARDEQSGIASVRLEVRRGAEVLANLSFQRAQVDGNGSGDWNLTAEAAWAGQLNLTVWAQDTAGNLNRSQDFPLRVVDTRPPVVLSSRASTPLVNPDGAFQEEGGVVGIEAQVRDASPVEVTAELTGPSGQAETVALARQGGERYRFERVFTERGVYAARVTARDPDGNTAQGQALSFVIRQAEPPEVRELRPAPGTIGPGQAVVSALVSDLNIDPASITLEVRVPPAPFTAVEATVSTVSETSRRVAFADRFFHLEQVEARVRARDVLGRAAEQVWSFTIDARPPVTTLAPEGTFLAGDPVAVTGNTTLRLERADEGSGLLATAVAVSNDDRALVAENLTLTGDGDALLRLSGSPAYRGTGNYTVFFSSADQAGNREEVQQRRFLVDDSPPQVTAGFEPGLLTARVREAGAGVKEVRARYWLAPSGEQGEVLLSPTPEAGVWRGPIPDAERGTRVLYAVEATDLLGNVGRAGTAGSPLSSIVQNHPPRVELDPPNGSLVKGTVRVSWSVTDRDGDPLQVSVGVRPSTSDVVRELAPQRGAQGSLSWDTREAGDGLWAVRVTARDTFESAVWEHLVEVANTGSLVAGFAAHPSEPGGEVRLEATLYRPVERAEATVSLRGEQVARAELRDDGQPPDRRARDGVFTGAFRAAEPGAYRVDLGVLFQDGRTERRDAIATAEVQHAFPGRIVHEPLLLLVVVGLPVALAGAWLWRRYGPVGPRRRRGP